MTWCGECRTAAANRADGWSAHMAIADTVALVKAANANRADGIATGRRIGEAFGRAVADVERDRPVVPRELGVEQRRLMDANHGFYCSMCKRSVAPMAGGTVTSRYDVCDDSSILPRSVAYWRLAHGDFQRSDCCKAAIEVAYSRVLQQTANHGSQTDAYDEPPTPLTVAHRLLAQAGAPRGTIAERVQWLIDHLREHLKAMREYIDDLQARLMK